MKRKCKLCGKNIEHKHPNAKFCCLKHKDRYHNIYNPRGYYAESVVTQRYADEALGHDYLLERG